MEFNKKLMHLRKLNGWSQEELADKLNVSRQTISNWELGDTSPDAKKLIQISKLFDTSVNELLGTNNSKNKSNIGK